MTHELLCRKFLIRWLNNVDLEFCSMRLACASKIRMQVDLRSSETWIDTVGVE